MVHTKDPAPGIWVEIMCGLLGATGAGPNREGGAAHHFIAYNVGAFTDLEGGLRTIWILI
ncbi:MAG: hypothetical protein CM1200mP39_17120 [Dehalococcoidia bacterium]|nr:MAG: hypothetical protein CM1200mP39_17120 [Dehalococcoidia bacterium]